MKKNIIGIFAVIIALCASAFTLPQKASAKSFDGLLWFNVSGTISVSNDTPTANATYRSGDDGDTPPDNGCEGSTNQCIAGFSSGKVNLTTHQLKSTSQTPDMIVPKD